MHFVVALAMHGRDRRGLTIVVIKCRSRRDHVHIHTERVHVRKALFGGPDRPGRNTHRPRLNTVPRFPGLHGADETLRSQMSVNVNTAHVYLHKFSCCCMSQCHMRHTLPKPCTSPRARCETSDRIPAALAVLTPELRHCQ